jgi:Raf kinase inhibitor-like YbhB/YbcL family protein
MARWPCLLGFALLLLGGCKGGSPVALQVTSPAFAEGENIPVKHTADGDDVSPELHWGGIPSNTQSIALVCEDPDAPRGTWTHWVLFNLPPDKTMLAEGVSTEKELPDGTRQGKNDFGKMGYGGPSPPKGKPHRYYFKLYSLDTKLNLAGGATRQQLLDAIKGHVVAEGQLMGQYGRS